MIRTVADLVRALQKEEVRRIEEQQIRHAPTIGAQYEGLTASLLETLLPTDALQIVSGFVQGPDGRRSGQIDCMLVQGTGTPVLYTDLSVWPIKDVFAVFEVKKTLGGTELQGAQEHLAEVLDLQRGYPEGEEPWEQEDLTPSFQAYAQIVGNIVPTREAFSQLPIDRQALYWALVHDQLAPLRIIFGYGGFRSERSLRRGFSRMLDKNGLRLGFSGAALPSLVVCDGNTLVKTNGHPYSFNLVRNQYVVFASSTENPLVILMNVILTKLSYSFAMPRWFDTDLANERLTPLLFGSYAVENDKAGWVYEISDLSNKVLAELKARGPVSDWEPVVLTVYQATILGVLGAFKELGREQLLALRDDGDAEAAVAELEHLQTMRIIGSSGDKLTLLTLECTTAVGPWGSIVAADNSSGRLTEWIAQQEVLARAKRKLKTEDTAADSVS